MTLKDSFVAALELLFILLFPYPVGLLLVLDVPVGWVYVAAYAGWAAFAVFVVWLSFRGPEVRRFRWPHAPLAMASLVAIAVWYALTTYVLRVNTNVVWFVTGGLAFWFLIESSFWESGLRRRAAQPGAKTR